MEKPSGKDAVFTVHIEGREAVELEGVEIDGFAEMHPDKILVDRAFMQMARKVNALIEQRAELLEALKRLEDIGCFEHGMLGNHQIILDAVDFAVKAMKKCEEE